jgi:flagellar biosynthetic protein FliP
MFPFFRHLAEMSIAMFLGMGIGGALFTGILATQGIVFSAARYPELFVLVMGFNMTLPMVAWMRHRGHGWRSSAEMAAAMIVPAIPLLCLHWVHVISGGLVCTLYCGLMIPAMVVAMLYRRGEYSGGLHPAVGTV